MYSSKQFILAAMLNNVFKNCKLREDCIYIHCCNRTYLMTVQSLGLLTKVVNKTVKLERTLSEI